MIDRFQQVYDFIAILASPLHALDLVRIPRHGEDVSPTWLKYAVYFTKGQSWLQNVLKDVLGNHQIQRLVREGHACQIFAAHSVLKSSMRNSLKKLAGDVSVRISAEVIGGSTARRGLMYRKHSPLSIKPV